MTAVPRNVPQVFECNNRAIYCETFSCRTPASWHIGRPDGPRNLWMNLCQNCLDSILKHTPVELRPGDWPVPEPGANRLYKYTCPECGKGYNKKQQLNGHMISHVRAKKKEMQAI